MNTNRIETRRAGGLRSGLCISVNLIGLSSTLPAPCSFLPALNLLSRHELVTADQKPPRFMFPFSCVIDPDPWPSKKSFQWPRPIFQIKDPTADIHTV